MDYIRNMLSGRTNTNEENKKEKELTQTIGAFKNGKKENFDECVICLEEMKEGELLTIIYCSHIFHKYCIDLWIEKKRICPLCDKSF